jgi:hypothetical protein
VSAPDGREAGQGLRGWWADPPRSGARRLINPWEYRHLRAFGLTRIAGGGVATAAGAICLGYRANGWAAFFLTIGALNLGGGVWYLRVANSDSAS